MLSGSGLTMNKHNNSVMVSDPSNYSNSTSPLQIFVRAKKKINDVFQEIEDYVGESSRFVQGQMLEIAKKKYFS